MLSGQSRLSVLTAHAFLGCSGNSVPDSTKEILQLVVDATSYPYDGFLVDNASAYLEIRTSDVKQIQLLAGGYYDAYTPQLVDTPFFSPPHEDEGSLGNEPMLILIC